MIWMEGNTPAMFTLMAVLSFLFGGLHCLAWNFEFPTRTEQTCWRVASLASAILPVVALGLMLSISYLLTNLVDSRLCSVRIRRLEPFDTYPEDWWRLLVDENCLRRWWGERGSRLACSESAQASEELSPDQMQTRPPVTMRSMGKSLYTILVHRNHLLKGEIWQLRASGRWQSFLGTFQRLSSLLRNHTERAMWRDYEDYVGDQVGVPPGPTDRATFPEQLIITWGTTLKNEIDWTEKLQEHCHRASTILTISGLILYTATRLVILVLLFTCLRSAPAGVYQVTPWVRFLPNFS